MEEIMKLNESLVEAAMPTVSTTLLPEFSSIQNNLLTAPMLFILD